MYKGVSKLSGLWLGSQYSEMIAKSANQLYCGNSGGGTKNSSRSGSGYETNLTLHAYTVRVWLHWPTLHLPTTQEGGSTVEVPTH